MSVQAMAWAFSLKVGDSTAKQVLVALANFADDIGVCWPSQVTLIACTELGETSVRSKLKKLQDLGLIDRMTERRGDGAVKGTVYQLHLNRTKVMAAPLPARGDGSGKTAKKALPAGGEGSGAAITAETAENSHFSTQGQELPAGGDGSEKNSHYRQEVTVLPAGGDGSSIEEPSKEPSGSFPQTPFQENSPALKSADEVGKPTDGFLRFKERWLAKWPSAVNVNWDRVRSSWEELSQSNRELAGSRLECFADILASGSKSPGSPASYLKYRKFENVSDAPLVETGRRWFAFGTRLWWLCLIDLIERVGRGERKSFTVQNMLNGSGNGGAESDFAHIAEQESRAVLLLPGHVARERWFSWIVRRKFAVDRQRFESVPIFVTSEFPPDWAEMEAERRLAEARAAERLAEDGVAPALPHGQGP